MNDPLVSVIMPAFNAGKYIGEAIQSVVEQSYTCWELLVIDDGSTDQTAELVKEWAGRDKRINYYHQENGGQGRARNLGLTKAAGDYIAFLDADDCWLPKKLQRQIDLLRTNNVDLVFSDAWLFEDRPVTDRKINIAAGYYQGEAAVLKFIACNYIPLLTVLVTKAAIDKVQGFSEIRDLTEDYHLWIRLLIAGYSFHGIGEPLACYRVHALSSGSAEGKRPFLTLNCLQEIGREWPEYSAAVKDSMYRVINDHLTTMNISNWPMAERLLKTRNGLAKEKVSILVWKTIYGFFGKKMFRILFTTRMRISGAMAGISKAEGFHLPVFCLG